MENIELRSKLSKKFPGIVLLSDSEWRDIISDPLHDLHGTCKLFEKELVEDMKRFDIGPRTMHMISPKLPITVMASTVIKYNVSPPKLNPSKFDRVLYTIKDFLYSVVTDIRSYVVGAIVAYISSYF